MKRRDEGKTTLVDFLRSIKFSSRSEKSRASQCSTHFAELHPQARQPQGASGEDQKLVRSGN